MSRIGKLPIIISEGVQVTTEGREIIVSGPKGSIKREIPKRITIEIVENQIRVKVAKDTKMDKALHGTYRAHLANMVKGVKEGWSKQLELVGSGYRAEVKEGNLVIIIGFSHPVVVNLPEGLSAKVEKNIITLESADKEQLGSMAAKIRSIRPPEPYKGKGILYLGEIIRRKAGKAAAGAGAQA